MFNAIQWAESTGMIAADAIWQVASGEIAIHPYKDKILKLVRDKNVRILTNSFIYDEGVAEILNENCLASINLSIDAGTSKTWNKVKGVNNFDNVLKNLEKYSACSIRPEQVTLKYIILPGINDNLEDYQGIIDIMKQLKIKKLIISRDNRFRIEKLIICNSYKSKPEYNNERYSVTDRAAGYLTAMLRQSGMSAENGFFWPDDYQKILEYQWEQVLIPYWRGAAAFAAAHGGEKIALEMHPGFCVYNPETLLRLRKAVGPLIGANFDPSHLFWQGIDPAAAIRALGEAIYFFHAKDTKVDELNTAVNGVLDTKHYGDEIHRSWIFRSVGYGHAHQVWKDMMSNLRMVGYDGCISIEHEDSLMSKNEGLVKACDVLKRAITFEDKMTEARWF